MIMGDDFFICERCYEVHGARMEKWAEYTAPGGGYREPGFPPYRACMLCGATDSTHWFCSAREALRVLLRQLTSHIPPI